MRGAVFAAVIFLSACAAEEQNLAPPPGVDFTGRWKFNADDSDDPMHLLQIGQRSGRCGGRQRRQLRTRRARRPQSG